MSTGVLTRAFARVFTRGLANLFAGAFTGEFRGVLLKECNRGLGLLKDSPETLRRAARYLESTGYYGK